MRKMDSQLGHPIGVDVVSQTNYQSFPLSPSTCLLTLEFRLFSHGKKPMHMFSCFVGRRRKCNDIVDGSSNDNAAVVIWAIVMGTGTKFVQGGPKPVVFVGTL
jgi:hypothetical protein